MIFPILPSWPKHIIEYFKVPWTAQKNGHVWPFLVAISFKVLCIILRNFRPITEILKRLRAVTLSLGPVFSIFWKFHSAVERAQIDWAWSFYIAIRFMLLCIIPPNFRLIAEIFKEFGTDKRMDAMTDVNTRWRRWWPRVIKWQQYPSASISAGYISMPNFMIFLSKDLSANAEKQNVADKRTDGQ